MKNTVLLIFTCMLAVLSQAQTKYDTVSLGEGYETQSFYSLANGEIENADNTNWDLAFDASQFGYAIRVNGSTGTELYLYPKDDTSAWSSVDTTGLSEWNALHNSDTSWSTGAFNRYQTELDLGWGNYNTITHHVNGDSLYIIKLSSGSWKKLWIENLQNGVFNFRYANLDGSDEVVTSLNKEDYANKNFGYYSLQTNEELDREPENTDWDLIFTNYLTELAPSLYYGVTGVLTNAGITSARAYPVDDPLAYSSFEEHTFHSSINTIGYDWKSFNMSSFEYDITDSICYFVNDQNDDVWRLTFTGFGGSSTGNFMFHKEQFVLTDINQSHTDQFEVGLYPNPSNGPVNLVYNNLKNQAQVTIHDLNGKKLYSGTIMGDEFGSQLLSLQEFESGVYILTVKSGEIVITQKLILQ